MATENIRSNPNSIQDPTPIRHFWARVGVSLDLSEELCEKLIAGDSSFLRDVLLGREGLVKLDGDTFFPEDVAENNRLQKTEFTIEPTPLHDRPERPDRKNPMMQSYYYTFGTSETQPFQKGWVEVQAQNRQQADQLFRSSYPDWTPGVLNCSSVLDKNHFTEYLETVSAYPDWCICHGTLQNTLPSSEGKVYVFCEEHEDENGIREFTILGISRDKEELRKLLDAKVAKDEYGLIAKNGLEDEGP